MNKYRIKVSIIVPVYNVAEYITECFNSVASQTFTGGMECIFVDDCGTDDSVDIVRSLISSYHGNVRFRVVNHDHNKGLSAARNTGIREANGDFLYFLDSDDWIYPDCIETMYQKVVEHPDVQCVFAGAKIDGCKEPVNLARKNLPDYSNNHLWIKSAMLNRYMLSMTAWNRLVKRSLIMDNNIYFVEGLNHEDEIWNIFLSCYLSTVAICKSITYFYRLRNSGIMGQEKNKTDLFLSYEPIIYEMIKVIPTKYSDMYARGIFMYADTLLQYVKTPREIKDFNLLLRTLSKQMRLFHKVNVVFITLIPLRVYNIKVVKRLLLHFLWVNTHEIQPTL